MRIYLYAFGICECRKPLLSFACFSVVLEVVLLLYGSVSKGRIIFLIIRMLCTLPSNEVYILSVAEGNFSWFFCGEEREDFQKITAVRHLK